jgi:rubrerythrin
MKKTSLVLLFASALLIIAIQSCSNNAKADNEMQKPNTEMATANTESQAGVGMSKSKEKEESETESNEKSTAGVNGVQDIKTTNYKDMQDAFAGETTASAKYAAYSKKAKAEGYPEIAMLFKAASTSEKTHANNHRAVLEDAGQTVPVITPTFTVKTTAENLKDAIAGESYEITTMYPAFLKHADAAGNQLSLVSLNYAYKTEQKHKVFYEKALAALESNNVKSLPMTYYVCPTCGNTYENVAPKRCGISMTSSEKFIKINNLAS